MKIKIAEGKVTLSILAICIAFFVILSIFFTDPTTNTPEEANNSDLIQTLESADTIELHKMYWHPNKKFNVYVDNEKVGTITRNNKIFTGKTFKLRDLEGNVIRYEKEKKRFLFFNRSATFFDFENNKTLFIKEDKKKNISDLDLEYRFSVYNSDEEKIGYTKAEFLSLIKRKHYINNLENACIYNIEKSNFFPKQYTVKETDEVSEISVLDTILYTAINDSIISKRTSSGSSSSSSSRSSKK